MKHWDGIFIDLSLSFGFQLDEHMSGLMGG